MIYVFIKSARRLHESSGQKFNFDQIVLWMESFKLIIYIVFSFVVLHQSMMIYV